MLTRCMFRRCDSSSICVLFYMSADVGGILLRMRATLIYV